MGGMLLSAMASFSFKMEFQPGSFRGLCRSCTCRCSQVAVGRLLDSGVSTGLGIGMTQGNNNSSK